MEIEEALLLFDPFTLSTVGFQLGSIDITMSAGSMANILLPQIFDVSTLLVEVVPAVVVVVVVDVEDVVAVLVSFASTGGSTMDMDAEFNMVDVGLVSVVPSFKLTSSTTIDVVILLFPLL